MEKTYCVVVEPIHYYKPIVVTLSASSEQDARNKFSQVAGDIGRENLSIDKTEYKVENVYSV